MEEGMHTIGKLLILVGGITALIGVAFIFLPRLPWIGRLPGDIMIHKKNFTFYFPLATSALISVFLTLLFWLFGRR
jgi:hypothetical protein